MDPVFVTWFGVLIEISQHVDADKRGEKIIYGLDHIGLPSADFDAQLLNLKEQGFAEEFSPVINHSEVDGTIKCCMVRKGELVLEVYQFLDMKPICVQFSSQLQLHGVRLI